MALRTNGSDGGNPLSQNGVLVWSSAGLLQTADGEPRDGVDGKVRQQHGTNATQIDALLLSRCSSGAY
jgi:hypothetical protein